MVRLGLIYLTCFPFTICQFVIIILFSLNFSSSSLSLSSNSISYSSFPSFFSLFISLFFLQRVMIFIDKGEKIRVIEIMSKLGNKVVLLHIMKCNLADYNECCSVNYQSKGFRSRSSPRYKG